MSTPVLDQQLSAEQRRPRSRTGATPGFKRPPEVPWSVLGEDFLWAWAPKADPYEGEHAEVAGQTGSGKSYALATLLHQRALIRNTATTYICTKQDDNTVKRLAGKGWPICSDFEGLRRERQAIFWPRPKLFGTAREAFHNTEIYNLLAKLWVPEANTNVVFDEIGYVEDLSTDMKRMIRMYWREARALGISMVASKQRPQGVQRDQHSESRWKLVFPPADFGDMERFAELLGRPGDWQPVLESLDQEQHQFIVRNAVTKEAFITWIDIDFDSLPDLPDDRQSPRERLYGRRAA